MKELLLTVDTSSAAGSVALTRGETVLGETLLNVAGTHSDRLLLTIRRLLEDTGFHPRDLDALGVVLGPGAFTGVRVGVATVKGLALSTGKPVVGVSSLRALAFQAPGGEEVVCSLLDARKREVYAGLYRWEGERLQALRPERVLPPEALLNELEGVTRFIGNGSQVYREAIMERLGSRARFAPWPTHPLRASSAAALALDDFRLGRTCHLPRLNPLYVRPSEAELQWAKRLNEG